VLPGVCHLSPMADTLSCIYSEFPISLDKGIVCVNNNHAAFHMGLKINIKNL